MRIKENFYGYFLSDLFCLTNFNICDLQNNDKDLYRINFDLQGIEIRSLQYSLIPNLNLDELKIPSKFNRQIYVDRPTEKYVYIIDLKLSDTHGLLYNKLTLSEAQIIKLFKLFKFSKEKAIDFYQAQKQQKHTDYDIFIILLKVFNNDFKYVAQNFINIGYSYFMKQDANNYKSIKVFNTKVITINHKFQNPLTI